MALRILWSSFLLLVALTCMLSINGCDRASGSSEYVLQSIICDGDDSLDEWIDSLYWSTNIQGTICGHSLFVNLLVDHFDDHVISKLFVFGCTSHARLFRMPDVRIIKTRGKACFNFTTPVKWVPDMEKLDVLPVEAYVQGVVKAGFTPISDESGNLKLSHQKVKIETKCISNDASGETHISETATTFETSIEIPIGEWRCMKTHVETSRGVYTHVVLFRILALPLENKNIGTNTPDIVYASTGTVFIARTPESFTYDADGNMTSDGRFHYFWNDENRLVMASNDTTIVTYAYDHRGRMVRKEISHEGTKTRRIEYLWDDWNIIRETTIDNCQTVQPSNCQTDYVWGLDLDGTLQGAGGVGGLLAVVRNDGVFLPTYDANGNVSEYVSTNVEIVAHYDYSPFGEPLVASGPLAASFPHRFSTKPWCAYTVQVEYQKRNYRPDIGRWMSRDPSGKEESYVIKQKWQECSKR